MRLARVADSLCEQVDSIRSGRRTPDELLRDALARIEAVEPELGAFTEVAADRALAEAGERTSEARRGAWRGPLHGIPVAVKDLYDVAGEITAAGSRVPPTAIPAGRDADAVGRLRAAGAVVIGRTRTHEYAWGLTTQHESLGGTRNPYDTDRVAGGSSGGSAAAVAAGVVALALGTDTAGSIRLPAAWCGLVGHKPTRGLVSLAGAVPLAPSFDHGGALVRTVADARLALAVLTGPSAALAAAAAAPAAPTLWNPPHPGAGDSTKLPVGGGLADLVGMRIGVPRDPEQPAADPQVMARVRAAHDAAAALGAALREVRIPSWHELRDTYATVQGDEAVRFHRSLGHWPTRANEYGTGVRGQLHRADDLPAEQVTASRERLRQWRAAGLPAFADVDVLLMPVAGAGPSYAQDPDTVLVDGQPTPLRHQVLAHTLLASCFGLPACAIPAGLDGDGLPVGVQVIGPPGADALVLDVAQLLERALGPLADADSRENAV